MMLDSHTPHVVGILAFSQMGSPPMLSGQAIKSAPRREPGRFSFSSVIDRGLFVLRGQRGNEVRRTLSFRLHGEGGHFVPAV